MLARHDGIHPAILAPDKLPELLIGGLARLSLVARVKGRQTLPSHVVAGDGKMPSNATSLVYVVSPPSSSWLRADTFLAQIHHAQIPVDLGRKSLTHEQPRALPQNVASFGLSADSQYAPTTKHSQAPSSLPVQVEQQHKTPPKSPPYTARVKSKSSTSSPSS